MKASGLMHHYIIRKVPEVRTLHMLCGAGLFLVPCSHGHVGCTVEIAAQLGADGIVERPANGLLQFSRRVPATDTIRRALARMRQLNARWFCAS